MEIIWNKNGDDYTAVVGEYELKVNRVPWLKNVWGYAVKRGNAIINPSGAYSLEQAKACAENAYFKHIESANPNTKL